jgi:hypothetical protein
MSSITPSPAPSSGTGSVSSTSDGIGALSLHNGAHEVMVKSPPLTNSDGIGALSLHNGAHEVMVKSPPLTNSSTPDSLHANQIKHTDLVPNQLGNLTRIIKPEHAGLLDPWEGISRHNTAGSQNFLGMVHDDLASMTGSKAGTGSDDDSQFLSPHTRCHVSHISKYIPIVNIDILI